MTCSKLKSEKMMANVLKLKIMKIIFANTPPLTLECFVRSFYDGSDEL